MAFLYTASRAATLATKFVYSSLTVKEPNGLGMLHAFD
jgi:hypothetical protein